MIILDTLIFITSSKKSPKMRLWKFKRWAIIDKFKVNSSLEETMFRDLQRNLSRVSNPIIKIFNLSRRLKESLSSWLRLFSNSYHFHFIKNITQNCSLKEPLSCIDFLNCKIELWILDGWMKFGWLYFQEWYYH